MTISKKGKRQLAELLGPLFISGQWLSNTAYNLKQVPGYVLTDEDRKAFAEAQYEWDKAKRNLPKWMFEP